MQPLMIANSLTFLLLCLDRMGMVTNILACDPVSTHHTLPHIQDTVCVPDSTCVHMHMYSMGHEKGYVPYC